MEQRKEESFLSKLWKTIWPVFIYMIVQNIVAIAGMLVIMIGLLMKNADAAVKMEKLTESAMELNTKYGIVFLLISALICIPIYAKMHRSDCEKAKEVRRNIPMTSKDILCIVISSAALALGLNHIIDMTPLPYLFKGYEDTNEIIFGGGIVLQIVTAGIAACIVEELSMRGIVYKRMKRYWGVKKAMVFSALVFGIYHLNLVQGVYAFFLGLFTAWLLERYDSLWAPCIAHMSANLFIIMVSGSGIYEKLSENLVAFCIVTCTCILIFFYGMRWMKQTNPLVELEFVKKEPDTLQGLQNEYREHGRNEDEDS